TFYRPLCYTKDGPLTGCQHPEKGKWPHCFICDSLRRVICAALYSQDLRKSNEEGHRGASHQNGAFLKGPMFDLDLTAYIAVRYGYGHFCSARCPAPGTATHLPTGRCQTHAPRLPVRTYNQMRQTGVRLRAEPQGSSRPVSQPHSCCRRQDPVTLPHP